MISKHIMILIIEDDITSNSKETYFRSCNLIDKRTIMKSIFLFLVIFSFTYITSAQTSVNSLLTVPDNYYGQTVTVSGQGCYPTVKLDEHWNTYLIFLLPDEFGNGYLSIIVTGNIEKSMIDAIQDHIYLTVSGTFLASTTIGSDSYVNVLVSNSNNLKIDIKNTGIDLLQQLLDGIKNK